MEPYAWRRIYTFRIRQPTSQHPVGSSLVIPTSPQINGFLFGLFLYEILYLKEYFKSFASSKYGYLQSPEMSLQSCGYISNRQGYFHQRSFVLCFLVPSPYYLSGVLSSAEFSFKKGESLSSKQEVSRGHKSNPPSDSLSSTLGVLWIYWCQFCYIYYHILNAAKKKIIGFF